MQAIAVSSLRAEAATGRGELTLGEAVYFDPMRAFPTVLGYRA
jgi:hypothetical protein